MPLISIDQLSVAFGAEKLLDNASFQLDAGERVCLIGRNGTGKTTLLRILSGQIQPDSGTVWYQPGMQWAALDQELPSEKQATVFDTVASGIATLGALLSDYHDATRQLAEGHSSERLRRVEVLQQAIEAQNGWQWQQRVEQVITRLQLPADAPLSTLSGGWQRRVLLGRALVRNPDVLFLDEPTNHLDVEAITWLEEELLTFRGGLLFVTHDRALLNRWATRILELDRGLLTAWPGNYAHFVEKKAENLAVEARHHALFDKHLAQEERWIRQGIRARRTRNEGRVRDLIALREERRKRREQLGNVRFSLDQAVLSGKRIIEATAVSYQWGNTSIVRDFSAVIERGDRIGLIGPNGCGKTTLLGLLLGQLAPQSGTIASGTRLEIAYFDQLRADLDPEKTVMDNVAGGREILEINGQRRHIISYLGDFLFTAQRARSPVKSLSGGERNRLLLARLFSQPANLLVMDEPTNDLDVETLELLEELLLAFTGTLLLVSHDRAFLDNVVTSCWVFEGNGRIAEYAGGYTDMQYQRTAPVASVSEKKPSVSKVKPSIATKPASLKLSYNEQRELEQLPSKIEGLEQQQQAMQARTADPAFYKQETTAIAQALSALGAVGKELEAAYARWEALEARR